MKPFWYVISLCMVLIVTLIGLVPGSMVVFFSFASAVLLIANIVAKRWSLSNAFRFSLGWWTAVSVLLGIVSVASYFLRHIRFVYFS